MSQNKITQAPDGSFDHPLYTAASGGLLHREHPTKGVQWFSFTEGKWHPNDNTTIYDYDQWVSYEDTKDDPEEAA